jgi:hypothetical protein
VSRRQDREGVPRCELQFRRNMACDPERHLDPKGWYVPHLSWEGWEEFNYASYALQCVLDLAAHEDTAKGAAFPRRWQP